ncbi:sulfatase-like hydrolase/transferase [Microvirga puerhi]|uniref:Sulfatase-like hydrolase/transferase n=1 Tax=Microvirga puerhi TaxID=2876078 RepID=A0ABS7VQZ5_9HYPH|nr:sulfatase-like hydrolase/transferase [Microvirga puerhi]MBZ6077976.1 sulfatase-like hydrolase/transferase [Microvirga puerhi]
MALRSCVAALSVPATAALAQPTKPNVVFILADNLGYGDLGCYGGGELRGAPTPRIDQMARERLRLTQYLVEPACTPSRAALMTGQYSIRNGLSLIAVEGSPYTLSARAFIMGELFKGAGYATAIYGKWHLGSEPQSLPIAIATLGVQSLAALNVNASACKQRRISSSNLKCELSHAARPARDAVFSA